MSEVAFIKVYEVLMVQCVSAKVEIYKLQYARENMQCEIQFFKSIPATRNLFVQYSY